MPQSSKYIRIIIPLVIIAMFACVIITLYLFKPSAKRSFTPPPPSISVDTLFLEEENITVILQSYGLVQPRIDSQLAAQVTGKILWVAESFRNGGHFSEGETLVTIEDSDYQVEVDIAYASLADARSQLEEQQALADQAKQDWERLNRSGQPSPLVLRKPQVAAALANVKSAEARYKRAKLNLSRTTITAPFDGRVKAQFVDIGRVVNSGTALADIYSTDAAEIHLPLKHHELSLINLPTNHVNDSEHPNVTVISQLVGNEAWPGKIIRTAGAVDENSRQLSVVARIEKPFSTENKFPLKIGQYVTAKIEGKPLNRVIRIPNTAIYQGRYVYVLEGDVVNRRDIEVRWQNDTFSVISAGLVAGEKLVTTPLGRISSGTKVKTTDKDNALSTTEAQRAYQQKAARETSAHEKQP